MSSKFDLIVIGSGSAGSAAASKCRRAGWSVAVIDSLPFGGTCALRGCDPKKVLVGVADLVNWSRRMRKENTVKGDLAVDWQELMRFKRSFTDPVPKQKEESLAKAGIQSFHGRAEFVSANVVAVNGDQLEGRFILVATGAKPAILHIEGKEHLVDSTQFLELERLPREILFVGGGYIAMEFAHIAVQSGTRVTVLHRGKRVLEGFDPDLVSMLAKRTGDLGVILHTETTVEGIEKSGDKFIVHASQQGRKVSFNCDLAVHAAGRVADLEDLNLEKANIEYDKDGVKVNRYLQSVSNPAVYAGGDSAATEGPPLTPVAGYDGQVISSNLLKGNHKEAEYHAIPTIVFTIPPLASLGLSELAAKEKGLRFRKNHLETGGWYSSRRVGEKTAAFKILIDEGSDQILGAHLLGPAADETINIFTVAMRAGMTAEQLKHILFSYPSHASDVPYML